MPRVPHMRGDEPMMIDGLVTVKVCSPHARG